MSHPSFSPARVGRARAYRSALAVLAFTVLPVSLSWSQQPSMDELETRLDRTIRSACHGYMIDSLPDFLSGARDWLNENTPFCQTVRTLPEDASLTPVIEEYEVLDDTSISALRRHYGRNDQIHLQCQDWMCEHVRVEAREDGHPISQVDYRKIEQHCEGRYECIERWFESWPRPLPTQTTQLSLDALLEEQAQMTGSTQGPPSSSGLTLDGLMAESSPAGREQPADDVSLEQARELAQQKYTAIDKACQCSLEGWGCYAAVGNSTLESDVESQRRRACINWYNEEMSAAEPTTAEQALAQAEAYSEALATVREKDARIEAQGGRLAGPGDTRRGSSVASNRQGNVGSGGYEFSCYAPSTQVCVDYSLFEGRNLDRFKAQCTRGGNRIVSGCDASGPSCSMRSAMGRQTTYAPTSDPRQVRQACIANGGQFSP